MRENERGREFMVTREEERERVTRSTRCLSLKVCCLGPFESERQRREPREGGRKGEDTLLAA